MFFRKILILSFCSAVAQADWTLHAIYNDSDLKLDGAYRLKNGNHKSTYVNGKIQNAASKSVTMIGYKNLTEPKSQGHLCISANDTHGESFAFCFDSQTSHAMTWGRSKTKKITTHAHVAASAPTPSDIIDDTVHYARVFFKNHEGHNIAHAKHAYDNVRDGDFDLMISGSAGLYHLKLSEVAR